MAYLILSHSGLLGFMATVSRKTPAPPEGKNNMCALIADISCSWPSGGISAASVSSQVLQIDTLEQLLIWRPSCLMEKAATRCYTFPGAPMTFLQRVFPRAAVQLFR